VKEKCVGCRVYVEFSHERQMAVVFRKSSKKELGKFLSDGFGGLRFGCTQEDLEDAIRVAHRAGCLWLKTALMRRL
jgi:hypothetical protein